MKIKNNRFQKFTLLFAITLSSASVRADPSIKIVAERVSKRSWAWHSMELAVRLQNVSNKSISFQPPFIGVRVGDSWTNIDFLVDHGGIQLRRRYTGSYEASFKQKTLTLQPGEMTSPFVFDIQKDESNWGIYWCLAESIEKSMGHVKYVGARLGWGHYTVRAKFFSPVNTNSEDSATWRGEVVSDPIAFTIL